MPHKSNADRRDKIPKQKRRVTNYAEYDESLRQRGDLTVWISDDALAVWSAPPCITPGGQPVVRRDLMPEPQDVPEKAFFCAVKRCHLGTGTGPAQR